MSEKMNIEDEVARLERDVVSLNHEIGRLVSCIDKCRESAGLKPSPDGPTGDVTNLLHRGDLAKQYWARLLLERDDVQGRKVLERMVAYYEEHDGKADDFGRLFIVIDAQAALGND